MIHGNIVQIAGQYTRRILGNSLLKAVGTSICGHVLIIKSSVLVSDIQPVGDGIYLELKFFQVVVLKNVHRC